MAKAKKAAESSPSATPAPAKKRAAAKKTTKSAAPSAAPGVPLIDTNLAAQAAAKMVASRTSIAPGATDNGASAPSKPDAPKAESAAFKQLKQGVHKPFGQQGVGNLLGTPPGQKKSNLPFMGGKQTGRNQTFGADVNRTGVPRRTGG